jgi:hypothetical protein
MYIQASKLHCAMYPNTWDAIDSTGKWKFLKEGRTMVALAIMDSLHVSGLEVAIEGVDYPSLSEFKSACHRNANLTVYQFTNSRGESIGLTKLSNLNDYTAAVKRPGDSSYQPVWTFPFPRIQTIDHRGQYIVRWEGNRMTVRRHGVQRVYDFVSWTVSETNSGSDIDAPMPPSGVTIH